MRQGPLIEKIGGRIWARAFIGLDFRLLLEESPGDAASTFLTERVIPLYNTRSPNNYIRFFFNFLRANFTRQEMLDIIADTFDKTKQKYRDLASKLKGNLFSLLENNVAIFNPPLEQDIDGPYGANNPLTRDQWVRIYTKAYLDDPFRDRLQNNPAEAVEEFDDTHGLGHNPGTRIFKFPDLNDLLNKIPAGHPLKDPATLAMTLQRIASGSDPKYEAFLDITLSC